MSVLFIPYLLLIKDLQIAKFPCHDTLISVNKYLSLLFIPYLLRIKDLQIAEFSCRETLNNEYEDLFAEDIS